MIHDEEKPLILLDGVLQWRIWKESQVKGSLLRSLGVLYFGVRRTHWWYSCIAAVGPLFLSFRCSSGDFAKPLTTRLKSGAPGPV
jgi:hypothetical protein